MSRIQLAIDEIRSLQPSSVMLMEQYVLTGDRELLGQLRSRLAPSWLWGGRVLAEALAVLAEWTEQDRRLLHVLCTGDMLPALGNWLNGELAKEAARDDVVHTVLAELETCEPTAKDVVALFTRVTAFAANGKANSAGRFVLGLSDPDLRSAVLKAFHDCTNLSMVEFLIDFAPERVPPLLPALLRIVSPLFDNTAASAAILRKGGKRFEEDVSSFFESIRNHWQRFQLGQVLFEYDAARYGQDALQAARDCLKGDPITHNDGPVGEWMLEKFGKDALPDLLDYFARPPQFYLHWRADIIAVAVRVLGPESLPLLHAALKTNDLDMALSTLPHLMALHDHSQDELILQTLERGFEDKQKAIRFINLAARWTPALVAESLWPLLASKSKTTRDAAARALGKMGDIAVPRAGELLADKKADTRAAAVALLTTANTPHALELLEKRAEVEPDENVRDAIVLGLDTAWTASGRTFTRGEIESRIARVADKLKRPQTEWINETGLKALAFKDGVPLGMDFVRYMLYRQSRMKEIRPDVEAKPLYAMIDRKTSPDLAIEILKAYFASKVDANDRWALALAAILGDDRIVPILNQQIRQWAETNRGKMAEYAVEALALLGTDTALLTVDALAIRYRAKNKNVGKAAVDAFAAAAANLGITTDELGDRVVPWLGFEPNRKRIIDCGTRHFEARISSDLKLQFIDLDKNKPIASLPKTVPKEVLAEFKELGATLREVVRAQTLRLENLMVRQQRWPVQRWNQLFTMHPLLLPIATRLVWGAYDDAATLQATFRPLDDRTLTQATDHSFTLPISGTIGIIHPLELSENERKAWQTHLADYEVSRLFPQLERPVVLLAPEHKGRKSLSEYAGTLINGMTFRGRADRLGWTRGSVCEAGSITAYIKSFPTASVDALLGIDGMYMGMDISVELKLKQLLFVPVHSVKTGSYTYDEPTDENDPRVLPFGAVPPIVYSEVLGDLHKIAGKKGAAAGNDQ